MPNDKAGKFHMNPKTAEQSDKMAGSTGGGGAPAPEPAAPPMGGPPPAGDMGGGAPAGDLVNTMAQMAQESGDMGLAEWIMQYPGNAEPEAMAAPPAAASAPAGMSGY